MRLSKRHHEILRAVLTYGLAHLDEINSAMQDVHLPVQTLTTDDLADLAAYLAAEGNEVIFQVQFCCYQYNNSRLRNGFYPCSKNFSDLHEAQVFAARVKALARRNHHIPEGSGELAAEFVHGGYVERYTGIVRICHDRIE